MGDGARNLGRQYAIERLKRPNDFIDDNPGSLAAGESMYLLEHLRPEFARNFIQGYNSQLMRYGYATRD